MAGYPLPDDINPDGYKCVLLRIPDSPGHTRAFWGHLFQLARWWSWERDELKRGTEVAQVWSQVWADARNLYDETGGECPADLPEPLPAETVTEYIDNYIAGGADCQEQEDNVTPLLITRIGGKTLLTEACCGQETNFYSLSQENVSLDDSGAPKIESINPKDVPVDPYAFSATESNQACYAASATQAIQARMGAFAADLIAIQAVAVDFVSLGLDEVYDVAVLAADLLGLDSVADMLTVDADGVAEFIESGDVYDALVENWTFTGPVSRADLGTWIMASAPLSGYGSVFATNLPKTYMYEWHKYVNLEQLNDELMVLQSQCDANSGAVPDAPGAYEPENYTYEYNGYEYEIWDVPSSNARSTTGEWTLLADYADDWADMNEVFVCVENNSESTGYGKVGFKSWRTQRNFGAGSEGVIDCQPGGGTPDTIAMITEITGMARASSTAGATSDSSYADTPKYGVYSNGGELTFTRLLAVRLIGEAS